MSPEIRLVLVVVVVGFAIVLAYRSRRRSDGGSPVLVPFQTPDHVARRDVDDAIGGAIPQPWLVAVFSSDVCDSCREVLAKASPLQSDEVAVVELSFQRHRSIHEKYSIEAVPLTLVIDRDGVVRETFSGPVNASHLWAAVAELREPGSTPGGCE